MKSIFLPLAAAPFIVACADKGANYQPILDGTVTPAYHADLAACQNLARDQKQLDRETITTTVLGSSAGALLGRSDDDALGGAVVGALAGGAAGAVNVSERREAIVVECLRGRGHRVVG